MFRTGDFGARRDPGFMFVDFTERSPRSEEGTGTLRTDESTCRLASTPS